MKKAGTINIENITSASNVKPFLQKIWDISQHSWKNTLNSGIARSENRQKFYSDLTNIAGNNRWLSLWLLSKDQTPIAFEYHLKYKNKIYGLCSEFNKNYRNYSPGFVLDAHIVEKMFYNGVKEYDMGPTEDVYKMRWTDTVRQHRVMYIFNSNFLSKLLYLIEFNFLNHLSQFRLVIMLKNHPIEQARKA
ncbi:MAG: GNAT family N-acetyltransferase [Bacteroidetes bacterium]|nr:GNAT family N-acetyltransferase [Bacteroidota bacterium]